MGNGNGEDKWCRRCSVIGAIVGALLIIAISIMLLYII